MTNWHGSKSRSPRGIRRMAWAAALAATVTISLGSAAHADPVTPPAVPPGLEVEEGNRAFFEGHGIGTQNYICLPCPNPTTPAAMCPDTSGFAWLLFTPEAALFGDNDRQATTHFFSPNPHEGGIIRATWQHSRDTSTVWGRVLHSSTDAPFVAPDAIPWLLVLVTGADEGPTGGRALTDTTFIQRLNTSGGVAPSTGCSQLTDVGAKAFVPYTADYLFYQREHGN
jgi:hypothetical protein